MSWLAYFDYRYWKKRFGKTKRVLVGSPEIKKAIEHSCCEEKDPANWWKK